MKNYSFIFLLFASGFGFAQNCGTSVNSTDAAITDLMPVTITVDVPDDVQITDINLTLNILHTFISDLMITLQSPTGTVSTIKMANSCGGGDNIVDATFDDDGGDLPQNCADTGITPGTYMPVTPLSVYNGESAAGTWTLTILDTLTGDTGMFQNLTLEYCTDEVLSTDDNVGNAFQFFPNPAKNLLNFQFQKTGKLDVKISDFTGKLVKRQTLSFKNNSIDISNLKIGTYLVTVSDKNKFIETKTLIID